MSEHRFEIDAAAGPAREGVLGGSVLLVRVRMFDGGEVSNAFTGLPAGGQDVCCDLRPGEARELAFQLLVCAEQAEQITEQAAGWPR
jgi:hypothetical protein